MEPLSALSVATAVTQFLDFTGTIVSCTWKIYKSNPGDTEGNSDIRSITKSLTKINNELRQSINYPKLKYFSSQDEDIIKLGTRCNEIGGRLISALDRLQAQNKHQLWTSFRVALRTVWTQSELDTLYQTLESYRQQISMHVLVSLREQVTSANKYHQQNLSEIQRICCKILKEVGKDVPWRRDIIDAIKRSYGQDPSDLKHTAPPAKLYKVIRSSDAKLIHRYLVQSLRFQEIDQRYEKIARAHQETFEWIFRPPSRFARWTDFPNWIKTEDHPLYWVTGKAGAGKSTLMRYISDHPQTRQALQSWAADSPLLTASFFFWNSGSEMQMSYEGLVRTLLYQILEQAPDLSPVVFPHRVETGILFGEHIFQQNGMSWTWEELLKACRIMMKEATKSSKIMLFLDGMDEFKGKPSDLIDFVTDLITPGVKICASSRPWIDFEDAFGHRPHLRLEDLTYNDIKHFVTSKMTANAGFKVLQQVDLDFSSQLIENVCVKSSGVFLWVFLVTGSLLTGLSEGERLSDLQKRVESLPVDLENLFWKILGDLDTWYFERASQLFQIVRASKNALTLQDMSFADEDDPEFAIKAPCRVLGRQEAVSRAELMRRRTNACCKGLLEANSSPIEDLPDVKVDYLHRTVKDFLEREDTWSKVCAATDAEFNVDLRLYNVQIMRLKTQDAETLTSFWAPVKDTIGYAVRADPSCSTNQVTLLDEIDKVMTTLTNTTLQTGSTFLHSASMKGTILTHWTQVKGDAYTTTSFLGLATQYQLKHYISTTLQAMPSHQASNTASELLDLVVEDRYVLTSSISDGEQENDNLLRLLLRHGADPNYRPQFSKNSSWAKLLSWDIYVVQSGATRDFLQFGADPRNDVLRIKIKSDRFPAELKELVKQKRRETRWSYYSSKFRKSP